MIVRKIALNGWRNYEFAAAEFSPGTNVITGENAQGKTNLLEAVYLLTGGKSFRTRFDKELIGFGYTSAEVLADVFAFGREQTVRIVLRQGQRKQIWQNGVGKHSIKTCFPSCWRLHTCTMWICMREPKSYPTDSKSFWKSCALC